MVEALLGRRDSKMAGHLPLDIQEQIKKITSQNSVWDSALAYIDKRGHKIPNDVLTLHTKVCKIYYLKSIAKIQNLQWSANVW
jgi:hypothetical protein